LTVDGNKELCVVVVVVVVAVVVVVFEKAAVYVSHATVAPTRT
jgi:hypothetical protein